MVVEKLIALDAEKPKLIAVIGDALVDVWVHGILAECQDGCAKFVEQSRVATSGGAANAANCLKNWMSTTHLFSQEEGRRGTKTRFIADSIIFRHDNEVRGTSEEEYKYLRRIAFLPLKVCDAVLLCDYDKGFLTKSFVAKVISICKERQIPCIVDAKREPSFYEGAILKCNEEYADRFREVLGRENTVVTLGAHFPTIIYAKDTMTKTSGESVPCVNHVGAGDCFVAHMTLALAHGLSLEEAASIAHTAGRVYVQHLYNRPPELQELL